MVVSPDLDKALQAYVKAANMGNRIAAYKAGMVLNTKNADLVDKAKAVAYFKQAARHQYDRARLALAQMLSTEDGVQQNRSRALALYSRAAEQGEVRAAQLATSLKESMTPQELEKAQAIKLAIASRDHSYLQSVYDPASLGK